LLTVLCDRVEAVEIRALTWKSEEEPSYVRRLAAERLDLTFKSR